MSVLTRGTAAGMAREVYTYRATLIEQRVHAQLTFATVLCGRPTHATLHAADGKLASSLRS